jgi:hypothetical protein
MWLFDGKNKITPLVAVVEDDKGATNAFRPKAGLPYGLGIAGRAFKTNRPRVYVYVPPGDAKNDEPDYYIPLEGSLVHKVLLCLPIHLPVTKKGLTVHPSIYESKAPYGVICLGSELAECPLAQLRLPEEVQKLNRLSAEYEFYAFSGGKRNYFGRIKKYSFLEVKRRFRSYVRFRIGELYGICSFARSGILRYRKCGNRNK